MYKTLLLLEKDFFKTSKILDREWLTSTIHDDFLECGKSGFLFDKEKVMEGLLSCKTDRNIVIYNFSYEEIGTNCWIVHYITKSEKELFYRTSIWVKEKQLQLRFHQASKLNGPIDLVEC